jgi:hypothetical protein
MIRNIDRSLGTGAKNSAEGGATWPQIYGSTAIAYGKA